MSDRGWKMVRTDLFDRRVIDYNKNHKHQLKAVLSNLERYAEYLQEAPIARLISAHFIHPEGRGLVALSEKGYKPKQPPTRLYAYPQQNSKTLYLITVGNKHTQKQDIKDSHRFIDSLSMKGTNK